MGVGALTAYAALFENVTTNMSFNEIAAIAVPVLQSDMSDVPTLRIPVNDSYKQETRNEQSMLWDTDWKRNANELYYFIYG